MRVTIVGPGNMGRALATRLLAGGHAIALVGRDHAQAEALATELEPRAKGEVGGQPLDVLIAGDDGEAVERVEEARVHVLHGREGRERIESAWEGQGVLYEFMQLGYEHDHTERHLRELDAGNAVVLVEAEDEHTARRAGETLAAHGAHFVNHYSRWMARSLVP